MKNKILFLISILSAIILFSFIAFTSCHSSSDNKITKDTIAVRQLNSLALKLETTQPDSSILLYKKSIRLLKSLPQNKIIKHLLANTYVDLSSVYVFKADYGHVKQIFDTVAVLTKNIVDNELIARILTTRGKLEMKLGSLENSSKLYSQALLLAQRVKNKKLEAKIISNQAVIEAMQGKYKEAEKLFTKSLDIGLAIKNDETITTGYLNLGVISTYQSDYKAAEKNSLKVIDMYLKNNNRVDLIIGYQNLANVYYYMEKHSAAIEYYQKTLQIAKELDDKEAISRCYHNLAEVFIVIGDKQQAIDNFLLAIRIKEKIGNKASIATTYRSIGNQFFEQEDLDKAFTYYSKSLGIDTTLQLVDEMAKDYSNMAKYYNAIRDAKRMIVNGNKAIHYFKITGNSRAISEIHSLFGFYYKGIGNYTLALQYYEKSLSEKKTLSNDQEGLAMLYKNFADLYLLMNQHKLAKDYALQAMRIAKEQDIPFLIRDIGVTLSVAFEKQNQYKEAYQYLQISKQYSDSLYRNSKAEALTFAEARWNNEKSQQEISTLKRLNNAISAQRKAEGKSHKTILISVFIIVLLLLLILLAFWKNKQHKEYARQQQQLAHMSLIRLQNIRNRISPHFIFNVLNRQINANEQPTGNAEIMGLVQLLRQSLLMTESVAIPFENEIEFVKSYLDLESPSMGKEFKIEWKMDTNIESNHWKVPAMIMQIPVENALKHALRNKEGEKLLRISVIQIKGFLQIRIEDNGSGIDENKPTLTKGTGTGLRVIYQTIDILNTKNKEKILFNVKRNSDSIYSGTLVEILIPEGYVFDIQAI